MCCAHRCRVQTLDGLHPLAVTIRYDLLPCNEVFRMGFDPVTRDDEHLKYKKRNVTNVDA